MMRVSEGSDRSNPVAARSDRLADAEPLLLLLLVRTCFVVTAESEACAATFVSPPFPPPSPFAGDDMAAAV